MASGSQGTRQPRGSLLITASLPEPQESKADGIDLNELVTYVM